MNPYYLWKDAAMWVSLHDWCSVLECLTSGQRVVLAVSGRSKNKEPLSEIRPQPHGTIRLLDRLVRSSKRNGFERGSRIIPSKKVGMFGGSSGVVSFVFK